MTTRELKEGRPAAFTEPLLDLDCQRCVDAVEEDSVSLFSLAGVI